MNICSCGKEVKSKKEIQNIRLVLNNPGTVEFKAPAQKCLCGSLVFHEDDADAIFDSFDEAHKKKHMH